MHPWWHDSLLAVTGVVAVASLVVWLWLRGALRRLEWRERDASGAPDELVSVIVPARNEEQDLEASLRSILAQQEVRLELLVVNDHSTDRTGAIADRVAADDARVRVIHDPPLAPGWLGKVNGMQSALAQAGGRFVLLSDADIMHAPTCLATALVELERRRLDLVSIFPRMECVSLWENVNLPMMASGLAHLAGPGIVDPKSSDALAAGAFILVRREALDAVGQFSCVKHESLDDVMLARRLKEAGFRVAILAAPDLLWVRLFKGNRHAFWGPTKNVLGILNGRIWLAPAVSLMPAIVYWTPVAAVAAGLWSQSWLLVAAGAATYALQYGTLLAVRRLLWFRPAKALLFPLVPISVACCIGRALYHYLVHGAVVWRARSIKIRGAEE